MLVEAAAGTGKTTALVDRIVALVTAGKCPLDQVAAVTFTRQAAAELRERLQAKLPGAEQCLIGTVHSFCGRLLRERPVEAGVDPDFEELDEERDARLRDEAWERFGNELYAADDPVLDELEELGLTLAELQPAFREFAEYPDVADWPAPAVKLPALRPLAAALREYAKHLEQNLPAADGTDDLAGLFRRVLRMLRTQDLQRAAEVAEVLEQFQPDRKCTQKNWPGGKEQALREHDRWNAFARDVAVPFVTAWRAHRYPTVLGVLRRAQTVYDRQRQTARGLNFQDLLLRAAALLRDRPQVRQYFRRRFTHVLVDEFQDTDPVQAEVMLLLTAAKDNENDWRKCRPVPGSLFVVGDPKQSIYRFRRADIVTYNTVKEIITATGGQCVTLTANFRSAPPVVDWVNGVFAGPGFFPSVADEFSPVYTPFLVGRAEAAVAPGVWPLSLPASLANQEDLAVHEADWLARHIRAEVDSGRRTAGDFLVITRSKRRLSLYADALRRLGLPHEVTGGSSLNEVRELGLWHTALRAALEPDNPVALVAALRSELFGFSDQELYAYRQAGGRFDWRSAIPVMLSEAKHLAIDFDEPRETCEALPLRDSGLRQNAQGDSLKGAVPFYQLAEAFAVLRRHADWCRTLPPMIALERVATDLALWPMAAAAAGGDVQAGSFGKAVELLRAAQADRPTAAELVAQLGRLVEQADQHDGASATAPGGAVVRVMNLHKVKGLQAPVVFLADPAGAAAHPVRLHVDRSGPRVTGYLALHGEANSFGKAPVLAHPLDWERLAAREQQFLDAEEHRLLYVAATRAKDQLIVSLRAKRSESNPWHPFSVALAGQPLFADPGPQSAPAVKPVTVSPTDVTVAHGQIAARWQAVLAPTYATRAAKPALLPSPTPSGHGDEEGMRWGSVIHLLLQTAARATPGNLDAAAVSALRTAELEPALAAEAVAVVRRVMGSDLWRRAQSARQLLTEVPFTVCRPADDGAVVRGVIDLAFEEEGGWVLVDYKTDRVSEDKAESLLATYRPQLEAYAACWTECTGRPVRELGLYATRVNRYLVLR